MPRNESHALEAIRLAAQILEGARNRAALAQQPAVTLDALTVRTIEQALWSAYALAAYGEAREEMDASR